MSLLLSAAIAVGALILLLFLAAMWMIFITPNSKHPLSWPSLILLFFLAAVIQGINIICICTVFAWDRVCGRPFRWDRPGKSNDKT